MAEPLETVEIHNPDQPGEYLTKNKADLKPEDRVRGAEEATAARAATLAKVTTPDDSDADAHKRGPGRPRKE